MRFFYAIPSGIFENENNLPCRLLAGRHGDEGDMLRFAYDPDANVVYVQDEHFRSRISDGDEDAWGFLNAVMEFLEKEFGTRFAARRYGEPENVPAMRSLSQYELAWNRLSRFLREDSALAPIDLSVCEYSAKPARDPDVEFLPNGDGRECGDGIIKGPCLMVNRESCEGDEDSHKNVGEALADFYLDNLIRITRESGTKETRDILRGLDKMSGARETMFAMLDDDGSTRTFKLDADHGLLTEDDLRSHEALRDYNGPLVLFHVVPRDKMVVFENVCPNSARDDDLAYKMTQEIKRKAAKTCGLAPQDMIMAFDHLLCRPFVSKLSRYPVLWERLDDGPDLPVLEAPISVSPRPAMLISSRSEEEKTSPGCMGYRVRHGLAIDYPFILVDGRTMGNEGLRLRSIMLACGRDPMERKMDRDDLLFMIGMGLSREDVLDFMAPRDSLPARSKYMMALDEALAGMNKTASIGPGPSINDWWHVGLQESLNRSQHQNDKPVPFNLRKKKHNKRRHKTVPSGPAPYDALLSTQHDDEMPAQKTTEQLLRENRI